MKRIKMNGSQPELLQIGSLDPKQLSEPNGKQLKHRIVLDRAGWIGSLERYCKS